MAVHVLSGMPKGSRKALRAKGVISRNKAGANPFTMPEDRHDLKVRTARRSLV